MEALESITDYNDKHIGIYSTDVVYNRSGKKR